MPSKPRPPPRECANCGTVIPRGAKACPECGADERTGWREQSLYDGLDLPEEAFESEEHGGDARHPPPVRRVNGVPWYWWCVGVALIGLLTLGWLSLR